MGSQVMGWVVCEFCREDGDDEDRQDLAVDCFVRCPHCGTVSQYVGPGVWLTVWVP